MAVSKLVVASTVAPYKAQRPRLVLSNSYVNGAQSWNSGGVPMDMTYDVSNNSLVYTRGEPGGSVTTSFDRFSLTNNTFSTGTFPTAASYSARIQGTHNGGLAYFPYSDVSATSYSISYSTNSGASWTSIQSNTLWNDIFPMPSTWKTFTNDSDVVPFGWKQGNNYQFYNSTAATPYTFSMGFPTNWADSANNSTIRHTITPLSRGSDDFNIEGYYVYRGIGTQGAQSWGSRGIMGLMGENKRASGQGRIITSSDAYSNSGTGYQPAAYIPPASVILRTSCIENRWIIHQYNESGLYIYDIESEKYVSAPISFGLIQYSSKPVYISATKKLYIFQSRNQTMYEFDVTFE